MKKRLLSLLLAAIMLMTTLSVAAFADETDDNVIHIDNTSKYVITLDRELAAPVWKSSDTGVLTVVRTGSSKLSFGSVVKANYWAEVKANKIGSTELSLSNGTTGELVGTVVVRVTEHSYVESTVVAPTCVDEGYTLHSCACGSSYKDNTTQPTGKHTAEPIPAVEATCTTDGLSEGSRCSVCGTVLTKPKKLPALGHDYKTGTMQYRDGNGHYHGYVNDDGPRAGDCMLSRFRIHECTRCGISYDENLPPLGHNYDTGTVTVQPTYASNGIKTYTCSICGETDTEILPMLRLAAPTLSITASAGHPKLKWSAVDGASKYWIYRSTDGVNYKYYDTTTKTSYLNKSTAVGTTYHYKVRAVAVVNGQNVASAYSGAKSLLVSTAAPSAKITTSNGKPKISWNAVSGATKYWIYRSTDGINFSYWDSTTRTNYTNTGAKKNTKYYYRVKSVKVVNGKNIASAYSNTVSVKAK
ncbi:putative uncharacterized protein [Firmicutes bacterium CAG:555]|nr:putative uncharacterized protein [Firmicutes bacterium CAG:555]